MIAVYIKRRVGIVFSVCCWVMWARPSWAMDAASAPFKEVQVPSWLAKSSAEQMALRDGRVTGPDFTRIFARTTARIATRDSHQPQSTDESCCRKPLH
jgi:hypothetical protein